jgi:hypothetical protein
MASSNGFFNTSTEQFILLMYKSRPLPPLQYFRGTTYVGISISDINKFAGINMQLMARDEPLLPFKETQGSVHPPLPLVTVLRLPASRFGRVIQKGLPKQLVMSSGSPRSPQTFSSLERGVRLPE